MTEPMIVLHVDAGEGYRPAGVLAYEPGCDSLGSLSSDPPDAPRQVYVFGFRNGEVGIWRSVAGADLEVDELRILTSDGLEPVADLEREQHTLTIHQPHGGEVRVDFVLWRTPTCPGCEQPPGVVLAGGLQVFCGNNDCHVLAWDPTKTLDEIQRNATWAAGPQEQR